MCCKCKALDRASNLFDEMTDENLVSWTSMISGSVNNNEHEMGLGLYTEMMTLGFIPNEFALVSVLSACAIIDQIKLGFSLHCVAFKIGLDTNQFVGSALLWMHAKCGNIEDAELVFESIDEPDLACWNAIIEGTGRKNSALNVFYQVLDKDNSSWNTVISGLAKEEDFCCFTYHLGYFHYDLVVNSLINMFSRCSLMDSADLLFVSHPSRNIILCNEMIAGYNLNGYGIKALQLFCSLIESDIEADEFTYSNVLGACQGIQHQDTGEKPDDVILSCALNACANIALLDQSTCIHAHTIKRGFGTHLCVASAIIDAYAKCGDIASSKKVFENISRDCIDAILFNTMITAFAHHGLIIEAIEIFEQMKYANLYPTQATFVAVIAACSHLGLVDQGRFVFESISNVYGMSPSKDNFACLVDLFARNGLLEKAKDVIESMPFEPWPSIWISLLSGCRSYANKELGELAAERILKLVPDNDSAYALMANVYAGDEKWKDAERMRIKMEMNRIQKACGYNLRCFCCPIHIPTSSAGISLACNVIFGHAKRDHSLGCTLSCNWLKEVKQSKGGTSLSIYHNWESLQACSELSQQ
ncbi:Pentatricopeptide repeat-containing protein, partial [Musa troglodytarum]